LNMATSFARPSFSSQEATNASSWPKKSSILTTQSRKHVAAVFSVKDKCPGVISRCWQMPLPRVNTPLQMSGCGDKRACECPLLSRVGGGGWSQLDLTDALISQFYILQAHPRSSRWKLPYSAVWLQSLASA
jgi:hypothetical protein